VLYFLPWVERKSITNTAASAQKGVLDDNKLRDRIETDNDLINHGDKAY